MLLSFELAYRSHATGDVARLAGSGLTISRVKEGVRTST